MHHTPIYVHPDGHQIIVGQGLLTACTAEGIALSIPIDPDGLTALGAALLEMGTTEAQDEAERAGNALGADLVQSLFEIRRHSNQEVAFYAAHEALRAMVKLEHPDSAAGGFAAAIVNVLELGIANLPKFDGEAAE